MTTGSYERGKTYPMHDVADAVARILTRNLADGTPWTERIPENDDQTMLAHIDGPSGAVLYLRLDPWKWRLAIGGSFPHKYHRSGHSITVAADRPAEKIAADVQRRLLPTYLPELADVLQRQREENHTRELTDQAGRDVAAILGATWRRDVGGAGHIYLDEGYVTAYDYGSFTFQVKVDHIRARDVAACLAPILAELAKEPAS